MGTRLTKTEFLKLVREEGFYHVLRETDGVYIPVELTPYWKDAQSARQGYSDAIDAIYQIMEEWKND